MNNLEYVVKMMSDATIFITAEEFQQLEGKSGLIFIPSQNRIINLNSVETITPIDVAIEESKFTSTKFYDGQGNRLVWNGESGDWLTPEGHLPVSKFSALEHLLMGKGYFEEIITTKQISNYEN